MKILISILFILLILIPDMVLRWLKNCRIPFVRVWRRANSQCIVCGRSLMVRLFRYCSIECSVYDESKILGHRFYLLYGAMMSKKPHHEHHDHDDD